MKIIKIASGVPAGFVEIEYTLTETDQDVRIVEYGPGASCKNTDADQLIQDLLDAEVGEFGHTEVEDSGKTAQAYAEEAEAKPATVNPLTGPKSKPRDTYVPTPEEETRQYDGGYGH